jgi:hypothetical protein
MFVHIWLIHLSTKMNHTYSYVTARIVTGGSEEGSLAVALRTRVGQMDG